jgi:hypothetical protein
VTTNETLWCITIFLLVIAIWELDRIRQYLKSIQHMTFNKFVGPGRVDFE